MDGFCTTCKMQKKIQSSLKTSQTDQGSHWIMKWNGLEIQEDYQARSAMVQVCLFLTLIIQYRNQAKTQLTVYKHTAWFVLVINDRFNKLDVLWIGCCPGPIEAGLKGLRKMDRGGPCISTTWMDVQHGSWFMCGISRLFQGKFHLASSVSVRPQVVTVLWTTSETAATGVCIWAGIGF